MQQIELERYAFDFNRDLRRSPAQNAATHFQSFCFAHRRIVSFDNGNSAEELNNCIGDQILSKIHRERERL